MGSVTALVLGYPLGRPITGEEAHEVVEREVEARDCAGSPQRVVAGGQAPARINGIEVFRHGFRPPGRA